MATLSVHPHIGYLNTKFCIRSFSDEKKMVYIFPINNSGLGEAVASPLQLNEGTLQTNYVFKFPGRYVVMLPDDKDSAIEIVVKDAIKFGGSTHKNSYVFDETPWCFVVMRDRTYFYNRDNGVEYVENISPDTISCVNKDVVLLSNEKYIEKTLYSLTEQTPIITFTEEILLQDDILITKEEIDGATKLIAYRFNDIIFDKYEYECEDFSVYKENKWLCIYKSQQIDVISLDSFKIIKTISCYNKFIKFTNVHYFVEINQRRNSATMSIKDVSSNQLWHIVSEYPISACEGTLVNDVHEGEEKVDQLFDFAEELSLFDPEKPQFLGGINISYRHNEIQGLYIVSNQLYYLFNECCYTINPYCSRRKKTKVYLRLSGDDFNLEINNSISSVKISDGCLFITTYNHLFVIKDKKLILSEDATVRQFKNRTIFSVKNKDMDENVYELCNGKKRFLTCGSFNWTHFEKFGIFEQKDKKTLYAILPQDIGSIQKKDFPNASKYCSLINDNNRLIYGDELLYFHGIMLWGKKIILPKNITALSEKKSYAISIRGTHVFLGRFTRFENSFANEQILDSLFDSSSYGKVLMSDDGQNFIYQKDEEMILKNSETDEEQHFPNLSFISQINGYRPLFKVDDSHRRPRIIDPLTKEYINQDYITNYGFISPDGKLYADSALSKYIKYHDKVNNAYISKEDWNALSEKYNYELGIDDKTKEEKREARKEFVNAHQDFFKDYQKDCEILNMRDFRDTIAEELGYAIIRHIGTDKIHCEITLGPKLWFLNYVAFSYDSRYVAIAGRYPNNTFIDNHSAGGLLLIYDMTDQRVIARNTTSHAVWAAAFTKKGFYAAYDSIPTFLYGNVDETGNIKEVAGKSFLTFSPDGKYMALSKQGYVPYKNDNTNWGHQPSTRVYIHAVNTPKEQTISILDDLSDAGIADTNKAQSVSSCSFSFDNKKLMMVGKDGTVVIRNLHLK